MNNPERWLGICAGVIAGVGALWALYGPQIRGQFEELAARESPAQEAPRPDEPPSVPAAPAPDAEFSAAETAESPPAANPPPTVDLARAEPGPAVPTIPARSAPPDLVTYDDAIHDALAHVFGLEIVEDFMIEDRIVQSIVTTVDSLDHGAIAVRYRAVGPVPDLPVVSSEDGRLWLLPENTGRYDLLVSAVGAADMDRVVEVYREFQPRFERAWRELGLTGTFDQRLQQVIGHLLTGPPAVEYPIEVIRPKVLYLFADPELEALSSGQKLLLRLGPGHAAIIRAKLQELLRALRAGPVTDE